MLCATLLTEHRTKEVMALRRYVFGENGNTPTLLTVPAIFPELTPYPLRVDGAIPAPAHQKTKGHHWAHEAKWNIPRSY